MAAAAGIRLTGLGWRKVKSMFKKRRFLPEREALLSVGVFMEGRIKAGILSGRPGGVRLRKNRPATIRKKGSSKPLIDTSTMVNVIQTKQLQGGRRVFVGIPRNVGHADPRRTAARVGHFHEFGTVLTLARPFIFPVILAEKERLQDIVGERFALHLGFTAVEYNKMKRFA